ncbi:PD-(D/E)XK nuclease family protein [Oceanicoccus sagamiensis]|uniref:PD-(D/E)XK endonuclease-like domain-containing protein n=1 Tax=Oceanicoccus sagamiensis TaxID=716816 RepID=A0A1X9NCV2_9GAMM|nr:PD-(D/E)XK nuclease family protein [Oceanicoccus sagamiensis]ARN75868.1 hypothetical protein BST96_18220 [Oceanicoccus sagamiensis]
MPPQLSFFDVKPIWQPLAAGQLILTPNQRLASRIRTAYAIACGQINAPVVDAPAVYSISQWIDRCWQQLLGRADPLALTVKPLTATQEHALWEQIVAGSNLGAALLRPSATAQQAASAYRTLIDWRQDLSQADLREQLTADEDAAVLLQWVDQFEQRCENHHWLPSAKITERVIQAFTQGVLAQEERILAIGFEDITPLHQHLMKSAGGYTEYSPLSEAASVNVVECDSSQQELLAAAVWAKHILKNTPQARVAIVIPDLAQQRQAVHRVLLEVFDPAYNQPLDELGAASPRRNMPFNFSAGYPLIEAPIISASINALSLAFQTVDIDTLQTLCQSSFYAQDVNDEELFSRLILAVREERMFELSVARFRQLAEKISIAYQQHEAEQQGIAPEQIEPWPFVTKLQAIAELSRSHNLGQSRSALQWRETFEQVVDLLGWPGQRRLDSTEYQQVSQWQQILTEFSSLNFVTGAMSYSEAVTALRSILSRHIFQPQSADSSLQILGTLEAAGLQFSHLWLQSMSEKVWPPAPSPNPLLPFALQRQEGMPHASAERELRFARNLSQRFLASAQHIVVSSPAVIDDNPASVSSLFDAYPRSSLERVLGRSLDALVPLSEIRRRHFESQALEGFDAGLAPVLSAGEKVRGGSSLFASQSACPFRAFATHRLALRALPQPELGLNAADRGSILHRALELIWQKLKNQQALLDLSDDQLKQLCQETSRYTLNEFSQKLSHRLGERNQQLEQQRLQPLLLAWLGIEKKRADFTVTATEARQVFHVKDLTLETRIDRVDTLEDGSSVIIDYKTGNTAINKWWGDRPDEPQLPLYSMLADNGGDTVGGIAFAQIRADGSAIKGVGAEDSPEAALQWKEKYKTDAGVMGWSQLKQHWQKILSALAEDFMAGKATVDPKAPAKTCQYCDLSSTCRINHQQVEAL